MTSNPLPNAIREAIGNQIAPVRPLSPAWRRILVVAAVAIGVAVIALTSLDLRFDLGEIPLWLGWGASMLQLVLGVLLIALALREAVPGAGVPSGTVRLAVVASISLHIGVGILTRMHSPGLPIGPDWISNSILCLKNQASLVLPVLALTMWLVFRALPLRAPVAGLLGAGGAAVAADAVTHLLCPMSDLRHVLVWHSGALLAAMAIGWTIGRLWQGWRWS